MSGMLYAATMAVEAGFALGIGTTLLAIRPRQPDLPQVPPSSPSTPEEHEAWDEPAREAVAAEFVTHSVGVGRQLSQFADLLAGDDQLLRERLRRIEQHMRREG